MGATKTIDEEEEEEDELGAIALFLCFSSINNKNHPEVTCTGHEKSSIPEIYDILAKSKTSIINYAILFERFQCGVNIVWTVSILSTKQEKQTKKHITLAANF